MGARVISLAERAWSKVDKRAPEECWPWTGSYGGRGGLGPVITDRKRTRSARRVIWEVFHGESLPENRQVGTSCRESRCVNPAHLVLRPWMDHEARFWGFVNKNGPVVRPDLGPCWEWQSTLFASGYAAFGMDGKERHASRVAWEFTHGPIEGHVPGHPELEVCVCHDCDNPKCVRPDHLFLGHDRDNIADMHAKGRHSRGPQHVEKIRQTREQKMEAKLAAQRDPMLLSKPQKTAWLVGAGWRIDRKRGEPMWFNDPIDAVGHRMRVEEAFELQLRRERSGVAAPRTDGGSNG